MFVIMCTTQYLPRLPSCPVCDAPQKHTWFDAVELLFNRLFCRPQHQVTHVKDFHRCHGILIHFDLWLSPVNRNGMTPQLDTPWGDGTGERADRILSPRLLFDRVSLGQETPFP